MQGGAVRPITPAITPATASAACGRDGGRSCIIGPRRPVSAVTAPAENRADTGGTTRGGVMNWWMLPLRMPTAAVHMQADRRLAFEVITAFGAAQAAGPGSSRVLRTERDDGALLVEFHSHVPALRGGRRTVRTVERVTLHPPERVEFEDVEGPLPVLRDRFGFVEAEGCTDFRYESTFALKGSVLGWLVGRLYVRPLLGRFMREHVEELRSAVESRASRSRTYPQPTCGHAPAGRREHGES